MKILFLFPHPADGPTGGYKVVYEYANALVTDGFDVEIAYAGSIYWRRKSLKHKLTALVRYAQRRVRGFSGRRWFRSLDKRVRESLPPALVKPWLRSDVDVIVATSPYTAWYLHRFRTKAHKYYFIQDREDWGPGLRNILHNTYQMKLNKVVISQWLHRMLAEDFRQKSDVVPNGFDFSKFYVTIPPSERQPALVSMMWSEMDRKDCPIGLEALKIVRRRYPHLRVLMFGACVRPAELPEWVEYTRQPSDTEHLRINNEAAIYLGTSRQEGWGLTVGEAMACGQAVVCTSNDGFLEMAVDGRNALVVPPVDASAMADAICRLISDNELRLRLVTTAMSDIRRFDFKESYRRFREILTSEIIQ